MDKLLKTLDLDDRHELAMIRHEYANCVDAAVRDILIWYARVVIISALNRGRKAG